MERNPLQSLRRPLFGRTRCPLFSHLAWYLLALMLIAGFAGFWSGAANAEKKVEVPRARQPIFTHGAAGLGKSIKYDKPIHHYVLFGMDREAI